MPACPWCQASYTEPRFPCRSCGRRPKDHVSFLSQAAESSAEHAPLHDLAPPLEAPPASIPRHEFRQPSPEPAPAVAVIVDVPDLVLAPRPVPSPAPARAASPPPEAPPHDPLSLDFPPPKPVQKKAAAPAASFDDMEMMGAAGSIDLASEGGDPDDDVPEWARPGAGASAPKPSAPPAGMSAKPISTLLASEDGGHGAAVGLADYGPAPEPWWQTPMYAYRVKMRQMELKRELAEWRANLEKAQAATDDALIVVAERGRKLVMGKDGYTKLLEQAESTEALLREKDGALAAEADAHRQKTGAIDERLALVEAEVRGAKAQELASRVSFDRVEAVRQRAEAMLKRAEIDLRSAIARAAPPSKRSVSDGSPAATDPDVIARTAERDARLGDLQRATPAVTELGQKLTTLKRKIAGDEEKVLALKNERAALDDQWKKRGAAHGAEVGKAQKDVRAALSELGRTMMGDFSSFGSEWSPVRAELVELDKVTATRDDDVLLYVMALDVADKKKVQAGLVLAGAAVGAFLLLFLVPVILSIASSSSKPPPPRAPATTAVPVDSE